MVDVVELDDKEWRYSNDLVEVDKGEWAYSKGETLLADNIGSCIVLGAIDDINNQGYLFHIGTEEDKFFEEFLEVAFEIISSGLGNKRTVYIAGALPKKSRLVQECFSFKYIRAKTVKTLVKYEERGIYQFNQEFRQKRVAMNPESGKFYH